MTQVVVVSERDNVATALEPLQPGDRVELAGRTVSVLEMVPRGHKMALRAVSTGEAIVKYGDPIGLATADIPEGAHVHTHNVVSSRGRGDLNAGSQGDD